MYSLTLVVVVFNIYLYERERDRDAGREQERVREKERHRIQRRLQTLSCQGAVSTEPDVGLELMDCDITTWAEVRRLTD